MKTLTCARTALYYTCTHKIMLLLGLVTEAYCKCNEHVYWIGLMAVLHTCLLSPC